MIKGSKINLDIGPRRLYEDIYLCTEFGQIIARREHEHRELGNILEIFSPAEEEFVLRNMKLCTRPLLFAISDIGPVFIDITLLRSYGLIMLIVPMLLPDESLAAAFGRLRREVLPSEKALKLREIFRADMSCEAERFAERLIGAYEGLFSFELSSHTESEAAAFLSERAENYGVFLGCDIKTITKGVLLDDISGNVELTSFLFALISFAFIGREYSSQRDMRIDIFTDAFGMYFDFGFKLVSDRRKEQLSVASPMVSLFKKTAERKRLICIYYQNEDSFVVRIFPWADYPVGNETKRPGPGFDY